MTMTDPNANALQREADELAILRMRSKQLDEAWADKRSLEDNVQWAREELDRLYTRIAALEAERDIWRERALSEWPQQRYGKGIVFTAWPDPTPAEIAARMAERKGRTP